LKDYKKSEDLIGKKAFIKQLTKQLLERAMTAELTQGPVTIARHFNQSVSGAFRGSTLSFVTF
jgi:hypothetical protein